MVVSSNVVTMPGPPRAAWAAVTRATTGGSHTDDTQGATTLPFMASPGPRPTCPTAATSAASPSASRADLVLLDTDPSTAPVDALATAAITETLVGGEQVWTQEGTS